MRFPTPTAHLDDWLRMMLSLRSELLAVIYQPDEDVRVPVIQGIAEELNATALTADRYRSDKQFLLALATARGLSPVGTGYDLLDRLIQQPAPIWIERAHLLRNGMLGSIRSIFDQAGGPIILSSSDPAILDNTDDSDRGGQWFGRRVAYSIEAAVGSPDT